jgi:hypothetical protein
MIKIQDFDVEIRYIKGKHNIAADAMGRNAVGAQRGPIKSIIENIFCD